MCRNIRTLYNFDPVATDEEIEAAATQFVRKVSGFGKPSKANEEAFAVATRAISDITRHLLDGLVTTAAPKDREVEVEKAKERNRRRFVAVTNDQ